MDLIRVYVNLTFVGAVALFPVVNPPATALMIDGFLQPLDQPARKHAARKIALYCLALCVGTVLLGSWVFRLFGISLPIVQLGGGAFICLLGWQQLAGGSITKGLDGAQTPLEERRDLQRLLFYPLTFPFTAGPGTISVLLTLSAHGGSPDSVRYLLSITASLTAITIICVMVYFSYAYAHALLRRLGKEGSQIIYRLNAFLVFCVGLQIAATGIGQLMIHPAR